MEEPKKSSRNFTLILDENDINSIVVCIETTLKQNGLKIAKECHDLWQKLLKAQPVPVPQKPQKPVAPLLPKLPKIEEKPLPKVAEIPNTMIEVELPAGSSIELPEKKNKEKATKKKSSKK